MSQAIYVEVAKLVEANRNASTTPAVQALASANIATQKGNVVPTTRADGTPLQAGDTWYELSSGYEWMRVGSRWVTKNTFSDSATPAANGFIAVANAGTDNDVEIEAFLVSVLTGATNNGTNFATIALDREDSAGTGTGLAGISVNTSALGANVRQVLSIYPTANNIIDVSAANIRRLRLGGAVNTGTPGTTTINTATIIYRFVKP